MTFRNGGAGVLAQIGKNLKALAAVLKAKKITRLYMFLMKTLFPIVNGQDVVYPQKLNGNMLHAEANTIKSISGETFLIHSLAM